ncbi:MAG: transposase, partial [Blautia sp.]|nr:transposase [Blautia sp.]
EEPVKENYNKSRRVHRGLFISNKGTCINADLNGAYQILRKAFPIKWDRGWALHPVVVNMA